MSWFRCRKCGCKYFEGYPPKVCPDCGAEQKFFMKIRKKTEQSIPDYWLPMLDEKVEKIHNLQAQAGMESSSFGFITDIHWGE